MKFNIKNKYKNLLTFVGIMFAFFIGVGTFDASITCNYRDSNSKNIINVTIDDEWQYVPMAPSANNHSYWDAQASYIKWDGEDRTGWGGHTRDVYNMLTEKWDLWMMENKKCPPYIAGAYKDKWGPDYAGNPVFSLTNETTYSWSEGTVKILPLAQEYSSSAADIEAARSSRILHGTGEATGASFYAEVGTTVSDTKWMETLEDEYYKTFSMENGKEAVVYVRGTPIAEATQLYQDWEAPYYDIQFYSGAGYNSCVSSNPAAVEITQQPIVKRYGAYGSPYFYIKIKAKQATTEDNPVLINCTSKTPKGELIISPLTSGIDYYYADTLTITVTPSTAIPATYEQKDVYCQYMLNSKDDNDNFNVSRVQISADGFNDGNTTADKITSKFGYMPQNGSTYLLKNSSGSNIKKDIDIDYYEFYNNANTGTRKLRFKFKPEEFSTKLLANSGSCPNLYVKKTGSRFEVYLSSDGGKRVKADLTKKMWLTSSGQVKSETYGNTTASTVSIPVYFYKTQKIQGETPYYNGAITFYVENNELYYYIQLAQEGKTSEKVVPETKITSLSQDLIVNTGKYGGEFGITYYYHVKVYSDYLTKIESYLKTINSQTQKPGNHTATIREPGSAMAGAREIFAISANEINDPNKVNESAQEGDGIEGTVGDDGTDDFITAAGKTDELQISDSNNNGDLACEDLFGPEDNRNSFWEVLHTVRIGIQIATPILLVLLTMVDFTKATALEDALPKAKKNAITRSIIAVVIFLVPTFINLLFNLLGMTSCPI